MEHHEVTGFELVPTVLDPHDDLLGRPAPRIPDGWFMGGRTHVDPPEPKPKPGTIVIAGFGTFEHRPGSSYYRLVTEPAEDVMLGGTMEQELRLLDLMHGGG